MQLSVEVMPYSPFSFFSFILSIVNCATSFSSNQDQVHTNWFHSPALCKTFKGEPQNNLPVEHALLSSSMLKPEKAHALQMSSPIIQLLANELPNLIHYRAIQGFD